jgi:hypothetical protein
MSHTILNEIELKKELKTIIENNYELPKEKTELEAVKILMTALGSIDAQLRDDFAYNILSHWILEKRLLTSKELKELIYEVVSDKMLFSDIGEQEGDRVFLRTFSSLLIALILIRDNKDCFLEESDTILVAKRVVSYCEKEKDFRGFVDGKGWAHSAAHISDVIDELAQNRFIQFSECEQLLKGISSLLNQAPHVFDAEEDERMATAVVSMIEQGKMSITSISSWLHALEQHNDSPVSTFTRRINIKHLIRSLYIRLKTKGISEDVEALFLIEKRYNKFL